MLDMTDLEDQPLGYLLARAIAALRPEATAALRPLELALPEFVCMRILSKRPGRSNAELARDINVSPQAMNIVVRGLESRGLVTRPASVPSGRALPARLTTEGKAMLKRAEVAVDAADERVMADLTPAQRREFKRLLAAIGTG
jgi:DNA-binding MarR family transcriptional regulator